MIVCSTLLLNFRFTCLLNDNDKINNTTHTVRLKTFQCSTMIPIPKGNVVSE